MGEKEKNIGEMRGGKKESKRKTKREEKKIRRDGEWGTK